jgi:DNA polymerase III subunit epsilon
MGRRFELTERAFHGGTLREPGAVVELRDDEQPGAHMRPWQAPKPVIPRLVDPLSGATIAPTAPPAAAAPSEPRVDIAVPPAEEPALSPSIAARLDAALLRAGPRAGKPPHPGFLILDTETNGLADPRLASVGMIFADSDLNEEFAWARLIRPNGWTMSHEAGKVNLLTDYQLEHLGCDVIEPLIVFELALAWGRVFVAHNVAFDIGQVIRGEWARAKRGSPDWPIPVICTMLAARGMLGTGKLADAYEKLMGAPLIGAHDALVDARACLDVLRGLRARGLDIYAPQRDVGK